MGTNFGTLEREGFAAKTGTNPLSHTLHVGYGLCKGPWGHVELWAAVSDPPAHSGLSEMVASEPTTQCWAVVPVWSWQAAQGALQLLG